MNQNQLVELVTPTIESLGLELWALEYQTFRNRGLLRIFIEASDGVTLEHCEKVSREVSALLDADDPFAGPFTLEVSSPGLDRSLSQSSHFQRCAGSEIKVKLRSAYEGRKNFQGLLVGLDGDEVVLRVGEEEYLFPLDLIEKAAVVPSFDNKSK